MSTSMMSADYVKPLAAFGVAVAIDKFILKQQDMNSSLYFGASTGAGILAAGLFSKYLPDLSGTIKTTAFYSANTVESRLLEIGMALGTSYAVNTYVLKNSGYSNDDAMKRVLAVAAADFIAEYLSDYSTGASLSYLV